MLALAYPLLIYVGVSVASWVIFRQALWFAGRMISGIGQPTRRANEVRLIFLALFALALFMPPQTLNIPDEDAPCHCFDMSIPHVPLPVFCIDSTPELPAESLDQISIEWRLHITILGSLAVLALALTIWLGRPGPEGVCFATDEIRMLS